MASRITRRLERQTGANLFDSLSSAMSASDLQSLLIDVFHARSDRLTSAPLLRQRERSPLLTPSSASARLFHVFDGAAFEAAQDFEAIDLPPAAPLGLSQVLGGTSQNNVLTTIRNVEMHGDSTLALALEAVLRRRLPGTGVVRLCASQRVVRLQPFDTPGFTPHFRLFGMVTAGRDAGSLRFEMESLREHIAVYLRLIRLLAARGFAIGAPLVEVTDMEGIHEALRAAGIDRETVRERVRAHRPGAADQLLAEHSVNLAHWPGNHVQRIEDEVFGPLSALHPDASFQMKPGRLEGYGYYERFALRISPQTGDGERFPVIDGGFTNWTARLAANAKDRLLISGIGSEFVCKRYAGSKENA